MQRAAAAHLPQRSQRRVPRPAPKALRRCCAPPWRTARRGRGARTCARRRSWRSGRSRRCGSWWPGSCAARRRRGAGSRWPGAAWRRSRWMRWSGSSCRCALWFGPLAEPQGMKKEWKGRARAAPVRLDVCVARGAGGGGAGGGGAGRGAAGRAGGVAPGAAGGARRQHGRGRRGSPRRRHSRRLVTGARRQPPVAAHRHTTSFADALRLGERVLYCVLRPLGPAAPSSWLCLCRAHLLIASLPGCCMGCRACSRTQREERLN